VGEGPSPLLVVGAAGRGEAAFSAEQAQAKQKEAHERPSGGRDT